MSKKHTLLLEPRDAWRIDALGVGSLLVVVSMLLPLAVGSMGTTEPPVPRRIEQEAVSEAGERSSIIKADKKAGKLVGPYLVGELIGEGTQGKVKEAVHSETLRRVAIKIINLRQLRKTRAAWPGPGPLSHNVMITIACQV